MQSTRCNSRSTSSERTRPTSRHNPTCHWLPALTLLTQQGVVNAAVVVRDREDAVLMSTFAYATDATFIEEDGAKDIARVTPPSVNVSCIATTTSAKENEVMHVHR